jgi:hypothetical protein
VVPYPLARELQRSRGVNHSPLGDGHQCANRRQDRRRKPQIFRISLVPRSETETELTKIFTNNDYIFRERGVLLRGVKLPWTTLAFIGRLLPASIAGSFFEIPSCPPVLKAFCRLPAPNAGLFSHSAPTNRRRASRKNGNCSPTGSTCLIGD